MNRFYIQNKTLVLWTIPLPETEGQYRIGYFGNRLLFQPLLVSIQGYSRTFVVH